MARQEELTTIELEVGAHQQKIFATAKGSANTNGTARIMGGTDLRDMFLKHFDLGYVVDVQFVSRKELRMRKATVSA